MKVDSISPTRDDVSALLKQAADYAAGLYPSESNHLDDEVELSKPHVHFVGAFEQEILVGIGAVKILSHERVYGEIKSIFVLPEHRGKGVSKLIMNALENHLVEKGVSVSRLETGIQQPEAIGLYRNMGYVECSPFGQYKPDPLSLFMEKELSA